MQNVSINKQPGPEGEENIIRAFLSLNAIFAIGAAYVFVISVAPPDESSLNAATRARLKEYDTPRVVAMAEDLPASKLAAKGQMSQAVIEAEKALAAKPYDILTNLSAGNVFIKGRVTDDGIKRLQRALALSRGNKYIKMNLAENLIAVGREAEAIPLLKQLTKSTPKWAEPHLMLAQIYDKQKNFQLAADEYKSMLLINGNHVEARKRLGILTARMGNPAEGLNEYMFGINQENQAGLPAVIEEMVKGWGGVDRTIFQLNSEISSKPNEYLPKIRLAQIYSFINEPQKAKDLLMEAKRVAPDNPELHRTLAVCLKKLKEDDQAVAEFNLSIALDDRAESDRLLKEEEKKQKQQAAPPAK